MAKIEHVGKGRNSDSLREATSLIHSIANSLRLTDEFTVGYEKSETGSQLVVKTIAPKVEKAAEEKVELPADSTVQQAKSTK